MPTETAYSTPSRSSALQPSLRTKVRIACPKDVSVSRRSRGVSTPARSSSYRVSIVRSWFAVARSPSGRYTKPLS